MTYLYIMAIASLRSVSFKTIPPNRMLRFAVVVPAHNEEITIVPTLLNLQALEYPTDLYEIVVIADNCSDNTAKVVREMGIRCIERNNPQRRGKGQALRHAFDILLTENFQAVVVVDADTTVSNNLLEVMNACLSKGESVLQARNSVSNPDDTSLTYLLAVGNIIENDLFLKGRELLGLPSILRGTGMCFDAEVLRKHPWEAESIVEDTEYSLELLRQGIKTRFVISANVYSPWPRTLQQASAQRIRWASGNSLLTKMVGFKLLAQGFKTNHLGLVDMGWCLFIRSKPLLLLLSLLLAGAALFFQIFLTWSLTLVVLMALYVLWGMSVLGITRKRLQYALTAPFSLVWLMAISLLGLTGYRNMEWSRTKRD